MEDDLGVISLWFTVPPNTPITRMTADIVTHHNSMNISAYVWRITKARLYLFYVCSSTHSLPRSWQKARWISILPAAGAEGSTWWMSRRVNGSSFSGTFNAFSDIFYFYHPASKGYHSSKFQSLSAIFFFLEVHKTHSQCLTVCCGMFRQAAAHS